MDFHHLVGLVVHILRPGEEAHELHDEVVDGHTEVGIELGNQGDVYHQAAMNEAEEVVRQFTFAAQHHVDDAAGRRHDVNPIELVVGFVVFEQDGHHRDDDTHCYEPNDVERLPAFEVFFD